jgi:anthranilate phosphoribosyltransferase
MRQMLESLTKQLRDAQALSREQVRVAISALTEEQVPVELKSDFLAALAVKGETVEELTAFARELRDRSISPPLDAGTRAR